jgi:hypothetical protein
MSGDLLMVLIAVGGIGMYLLGMFVGYVLAKSREIVQPKPTGEDDNTDALIVSFLRARPQSGVSDIKWGMEDHTRGTHDWRLRKERDIYGALDRLVAGHVLAEGRNVIGRRVYSLAAPAERLIREA